MAHIYVRSQSFAPGVEVEISGHPINANDKVPVEFPDNSRVEATIVRSSSNIVEIKVGDDQWRLAPLVPWLVGILIGLGIALLGTQTGGSLNPARQFGPAVISGHTAELWVFLIAPMVGAELAARLLQAFRKRRQVLTHRLCGTRPDGGHLNGESLEAGYDVRSAA